MDLVLGRLSYPPIYPKNHPKALAMFGWSWMVMDVWCFFGKQNNQTTHTLIHHTKQKKKQHIKMASNFEKRKIKHPTTKKNIHQNKSHQPSQPTDPCCHLVHHVGSACKAALRELRDLDLRSAWWLPTRAAAGEKDPEMEQGCPGFYFNDLINLNNILNTQVVTLWNSTQNSSETVWTIRRNL